MTDQMTRDEEYITKRAQALGFRTHVSRAGIFIKSEKGDWLMYQDGAGCWLLDHKNTRGQRARYHHHEQSWKKPGDAITYIQKHDYRRYSTRETYLSEYRVNDLRY